MFCKNCGNQIKEGAAFCANCGTPIKVPQPIKEEPKIEAVVEETPVVETPVEENPIVEEPVVEEVAAAEEPVIAEPTVEAPATQEFYTPDFKKPKKKFTFKKLVLPAIALVLVLALVILNFSNVLGFGIKTFGSGKAYLDFVQKESAKDIATSISDIYTNFLNNFKEEQAATSNISFTLDEDVSKLLSSEFDFEIGDKLDWINDLKLVVNANMKDKKNLAELKLNISDKDIISLKAVQDLSKGNMYFAIPELCKDYLKVDLEETGSYDYEEFAKAYDLMFEAKEALPDGKQVEKLITKYIGIAFDQIEDVTKESDTLSVGGIDQKCTVLEYKVSAKDLINIAEAVLEEAVEDKDIKKIIEDIEGFLKDSDTVDFDEDLYKLFEEAVEDMLDELDDVDVDSSNKIRVTQYINNKHEIIGTKIKANNETVLFSATAQKGSEFESKFEAGQFEVKASGTKKKDIINGKYKIMVNGEKICEIAVKDFDEKKFKEGYINGNFRFSLSKELIDQLPSEVSSIISILEPTIEIDCATTEDSSKISINLLKDNKKVLFGITFDSTIEKPSKVTVPSKAFDATDDEEVSSYIDSIKTESIIKSLKGTSIPTDLVDSLESILQYLPDMLNGSMYDNYEDPYAESVVGGYYNDYYDEYYY